MLTAETEKIVWERELELEALLRNVTDETVMEIAEEYYKENPSEKKER